MAVAAPPVVSRHRGSADDYSSTPMRIRGLDGLRAIAVAAVVVYHLGTGALPGGFLGVDVFFVISGFLITTLLMTERSRHGRIRFGRFYLRRARRLLPALLLMLAGSALLAATVARDAIEGFRGNVAAALLYVSNWWYIAQEQSYFELIGRGNMLAHLWSLAVEEQFYLVWPAVVALVWGIARARRSSVRLALLATAGTLAVLSTVAMTVMSIRHGFPLDADPTRVYFGTDTHAMSVLMGAVLAALWRPGRASARIAGGARGALGLMGVTLLALLAWILVDAHEYSSWLYRGGFLLVSMLVAAIIAVATHPASPLGTLLDHRGLRWIGERSYGIYLWHWPIFLVTRPGQDIPWHGWWVEAMRIGLVLAVAAASYRWVEEPIRHGALGRGWQRLRTDGLVAHQRSLLTGFGVLVAFALIVGVSFTVGVPKATDTALGSTVAITAEPVVARSSVPLETSEATSSGDPAPASSTPTVTTEDVAIYGDSVSLWSAEVLKAEISGSTVDAAINRSPGNIMGAVLDAQRAGTLRPVVIMHMGTAGPVKEGALRDTLDQLADRDRVVLVDSTARFAYVQPSNEAMERVAADYGNVVFADWRGYVAGHDSWLEDGLHLTEEGKPEFAAFLRSLALTGEPPTA
ncbi:acyltransferase family protein [Demequina sp. SYSU T00068]|uniref:acyltransferase family protein n=1 Tax=Demequina lignilytica TaxID=3051663 RepID=UPI00262EE0BC|nr:acyltransferase family protein [Demequina sp. SYSU T00068]MDN4489870.1 acyltransferase family protein [Demequina sp. SYSU T00068]